MNEINLEGLIGSDLDFYNRIMTDFYSRIMKLNTATSVNCDIEIDKISLKNSNNCTIEIINKCFSNSKNSLNILLKTLVDNKLFMTKKIKEKIEKGLQIDLDKNIENQPNLLQNCNVSANTSNIITINELFIKNCTGNNNSKFLFYNTGDANTNCGIVEVINALSTKQEPSFEQKEYEYFLNKVFGFNLNDLLTILFITFIFLIAKIILDIFFNYDSKIHQFVYKYFKKK
jgi:hypothetical protein